MILLVALSLSLLSGFSAKPIPDYHQCVERCGEDPLDDPVASRVYDACREKCVEDGFKQCVGLSTDAFRRKKCNEEAQKRCLENCGDEDTCIEHCLASD
ncbi:hypothetical protein CSKR_200233 [Clonorchis sinensis]|uniref:Uncharacterized protein n=1 Tax=Clonorchis sinensis TaxID=79923 RepID=A0A8T1M053_CLOSI|nr:hypothetical protein CSKR_200233 [Clonorchis sinensis]